ncbi:MAG TPA: DUF2497 domain-containing protein, partial [Hyphomicrobium sp.]|nr:DUF2497 domain-containing protein [Hyphomicrobium sp.]
QQDAVTSLAVNGSTVAPFPRPLREALKAVEQPVMLQPLLKSAENIVELQTAQPAAKEHVADKSAADATARAESTSPLAQPKAETGRGSSESGSAKAASATSGAASARADALLDAVVDLVQKQPGALSVFASGSSFISGVGAKKMLEEAASARATEGAQTGAPPKLDRAAAELLRPMLRQWLADNMPRIVEEALRSELTAQTVDADPGPGKA